MDIKLNYFILFRITSLHVENEIQKCRKHHVQYLLCVVVEIVTLFSKT